MKSGRYQLLDLVAEGGMARLYRARAVGEKGFSKILAIKRMLPQWANDPGFVQMLIDEARMASNLSHPNIVQVLELGRDDDGYFIVMEFVGGPNLSRVLSELRRRGERLPEACALDVVIQLLRALDYAHRMKDARGVPMNLVHRDVSPQNVLVTPDGAVKLSDFGVAKARGRLSGETKAGQVKGKVAYMAPEQLRGQPLDGRSDQFAAALILWECLAGRLRYQANSEFELMEEVARAQPLPLSEVGVEVAPELEAALGRALSAKADDRFPAAFDFAEALTIYHRRAHPTYTPSVLGQTIASLFANQMKLLADRLGSLEAGALRPIGWAGVEEATHVYGPIAKAGARGRPRPPSEPDEAREPAAPAEEPPAGPPRTTPEEETAIRAAIEADDAKGAAGGHEKRRGVGAAAVVGAFLAAATAVLLAGKVLEAPAPPGPPPPIASTPTPVPTPEHAEPAPARPAPRPSRETPAAQGVGRLDLDCTPGICRVEVDGKAAGFTPVRSLSVAAGKRRVRLVNQEVGLEKTIVLDVAAGASISRSVNLVLSR